jgi:hypothetical protein
MRKTILLTILSAIILAFLLPGLVTAGPTARLLQPRAYPYALAPEIETAVTFKVQLINPTTDPNPKYVLLKQANGAEYKLNDAGKSGDKVAGDKIYALTVPVKISEAEACLNWITNVVVGKDTIESPAYTICASTFPIGFNQSNTKPDNLVITDKDSSPAVADELLVRFASKITDRQIAEAAAYVKAKVVGGVLPRKLYQFRFTKPQSLDQLKSHIANLHKNTAIESAYLNRVGHFVSLPDDPEYLAGNQHGYTWINADDSWDIGANGSGITTAVLDSGVAAHPDLPIADIDIINHGTGMAGIVGAITANTTGIAGVAGEGNLQSFTVSPDGAVTIAEMVDGFELVTAAGTAQVVTAGFNITLAPPGSNLPGVDDQWDLCAAINDVVLNSGTPVAVVVSAAGNNNSDGFHYPAKCNDNSAPANGQLTDKSLLITVMGSITCSGVCASDTRQANSNYGAWIDVVAPAVNIRSTNNLGAYEDFSGTSFSSAMVAGVASQMLSCGTTVDQIQSRLVSTAPVMVAHPGGSKPRIDSLAAVRVGNTAPTGISLDGPSSINENTNTSAGFTIATLETADPNVCDRFNFNIQGGADAGVFSISGPALNELEITAGILDFETKSSYNVIVRVTDIGGSVFDQPIVITVNDLVENTAPVVNNQAFAIAENSANGSAVGTVVATDGEGDALNFSITAGNTGGAFAINPGTGAITVANNAALNFETTPSFALTVQVSDSALTDTATITVNLTNANEAPVVSNQAFNINENSANGSSVGTVVATDPDAATALSYSITAGNTGGAFAINANSGAITVANSAVLDFETTPAFALTVQVSDGVLTDTATVTVSLNNVVENTAPVVNNQSFSINENSANGSAVGTVVATDGEGDALNFSITAGNTGGAFAINPGTGAITVASSPALDFETTPSFALTVLVSDGVLTDTATITVNLNNLAETIPNPVINWVSPVPFETYTGSDGNPYIRYRFEVTNRSAFPDELFAAAPALPPCGLNNNSSRTWVYIYNGATNAYIYGFCALGVSENMGLIWFAIPDDGTTTPPPSIYITLTDRLTSTVYTSNTLTVP